ncbi:hypothetical protein ACTXGU_00095 [Niallia sp. 01092]|uniref:hypothetical protein n=1 Tax=Niallia sp. 01092 TaxID=3457759 RepID=UPI003FD3097F
MEPRDNKNLIVTMTVQELDELVFRAAFRASKRTEEIGFKGYLPFWTKLNDDVELLISQMDRLQEKIDASNNKLSYTKRGGIK